MSVLRKLLTALCFSICAFSSASAAAPITHAYLTKIFFNYFPKYSQEEQQIFMVGTLFPDIQYLGEVSRGDTHWNYITLEEVLAEPSPFLAGAKFHSYVDWVREEFVVKNHIYDRLNELVGLQENHVLYFMLKAMEDEVLFYSDDWEPWTYQLQNILPEEKDWGISTATIYRWHSLIHACLSNPPSVLLILLNASKNGYLNISSTQISLWNKIFKQTTQSDLIQNYVNALVAHFEFQMMGVSP